MRYADETLMTAAQLMTPDLANFAGNVHGGQVVLMADNLAYACASRYARTNCTTAAMDRVDFYEPVHIGELLLLTARVAFVGQSSLEVEVDVQAENITTGEMRQTTACHFTFVALTDGKPTVVPRLVCRTKADKARYLRAKTRRDLGRTYREERTGALAQFDALDESALDALMAAGST